PKELMSPGTIRFLAGDAAVFALSNPDDEGARRAALARFIVDPVNPLTRRSIVNRVWQYHFGRGIVDTPNDFGHMGSPPTHPELLDWLASELMEPTQEHRREEASTSETRASKTTGPKSEISAAWRLKRLHRLILRSAVYRQ